jgi:hypothetical protein
MTHRRPFSSLRARLILLVLYARRTASLPWTGAAACATPTMLRRA